VNPVFRRVIFVAIITAIVCAIFPANRTAAAQSATPISGADVYRNRCAKCHDQENSRAPSRDTLQKMSSARILRTLDFGLMMGVAYPMKRDEREAVANFLGTKVADAPTIPASAFCSPNIHIFPGPSSDTWAGWSPSQYNTRYQSAERAGLTASDVPRLKLKWALGFPGDVTAFAAPSVLNGTLFVGSASGLIQALDASTGCVHWTFQADGPVRGAILPVQTGSSYSLLFGDLLGWGYSLDAKTGRLLWKKRVEDHEATRLTASPVALNGVVFMSASSWEETRSLDPKYPCCTFRGSVTALRVRDGSVVWKLYTVDPPKQTGTTSLGTPQWGPSGSPIWSAPTVDAKRGLLYVTTGDNYSLPVTLTSDAVMAVDIKTGKIVWSQQLLAGDFYNSACRAKAPNCPPGNGPDYDFGSSALLVRTPKGKEILVAGQKSGMVYAFDPDDKGKILWQSRVGKGGLNGGVQWGMASDEQKVYAAVADVAAVLNSAGPVGGATFDPVQGGGLTALHLEDGAKAWFAPSHPCDPPRPGCSPGQPGAVSLIPGVVFSGAIDGHIRAFSSEDGEMLWDFDTAHTYSTTVNGVEAKGGSLDGAGPVIAGGMVFVNSGYPRNGGMPGNVMLAFAPE
jgi:polyvinyl alcohol dehydrogenase (cytochrome)